MFEAMRGYEACADQEKGELQEERLPVARSTFMRAEEIDRERGMSGWNPYEGEEEEAVQPYFMAPDYAQVMEEQRDAERELRMLQSMYPDAAKQMLPYVEEECDRMEYEGSPMFDEYPDRTTVFRIEERIYEQAKDQLPKEAEREPEEVQMMERRPDRGGPGRGWARDLARVLLLQEMHHRRCRRRGCRRAAIGDGVQDGRF